MYTSLVNLFSKKISIQLLWLKIGFVSKLYLLIADNANFPSTWEQILPTPSHLVYKTHLKKLFKFLFCFYETQCLVLLKPKNILG